MAIINTYTGQKVQIGTASCEKVRVIQLFALLLILPEQKTQSKQRS